MEDLTFVQVASLNILASEITKNVSDAVVGRHIEKGMGSSAHDGCEFIAKFLDELRIEGPNN